MLPPTWRVITEKSWKHHFQSHVFPEEMADKPELEWLEGIYLLGKKRKSGQNVGPGDQ